MKYLYVVLCVWTLYACLAEKLRYQIPLQGIPEGIATWAFGLFLYLFVGTLLKLNEKGHLVLLVTGVLASSLLSLRYPYPNWVAWLLRADVLLVSEIISAVICIVIYVCSRRSQESTLKGATS